MITMTDLLDAPVRGRPVAAETEEDRRDELTALRAERHEIAALVPYALRVHGYVQTVGESIEAERLSAYVTAKLEQIAGRK